MENGIQLDEIKGIIRRRRRVFLLVFFIVLVIAGVIALSLSPSYLSKSTILIEDQQIPEQYVKSGISSYVEQRLDTITQQVMSRSRLKEIIDQFGLYSEYRDNYTSEEITAKMRDKDIKFETISADVNDARTGKTTAATIAFAVSYQGKDPATVQKVANKLASLYLEENIRTREAQTSSTTAFLEHNLKEMQTQIDEVQGKISTFKSAHYAELPENNAINMNGMLQLERELDQYDSQIKSLQERKIYLQGQLANVDPLTPLKTEDGKSVMNSQDRLRYLRTELAAMKGTFKDNHPDIVNTENTIKALESQTDASDNYTDMTKRLDELTKQKTILQEKLKPQHPDLVKLNQEIQTLSDRVKAADTEKVKETIGTENPDNPAYINIRTQIETTDMDILTLQKEQKEAKGKLSLYETKLHNSPNVEREYNTLTMDYENAKAKYNEIKNKLMEAKVSQGMEETQKGERFTIVDNAQFPEKPNKPNRLAIALIGFVLAVGGAVAVAAFQESIDESFKSPGELAKFIKAPVLSIMPLIVSHEDRRAAMIRRSAVAGGALAAVVLTIVLVHFYVMPMDILMIKIQKRMMGL
jgi:polysaccharide biosynthesis transport protein